MKRRTSVLLEQEQYDRLERLARQRGTTVSEELREAIGRALPDANPNQGLIDLVEEFRRDRRPHPVRRDPTIPNAGDPDFKRWLRDSMVEDRLKNHRG